MSWRCDTYKLINDIQDKLGYINIDLGQDSVDQLAFRQREIRIMVARKDVAEEKRHLDMCQSGHASTHDLHLPSHHALCKVLSQEAQQLAYGLLIKS